MSAPNERLSRRDYFAGQALAGLCANPNTDAGISNEDLARICGAMADAQIANLSKPTPTRKPK